MDSISNKAILVQTACPTKEEAQAIGHALLDKHLASAVQIAAIDSLYWWQEEKYEREEWSLNIITLEEMFFAVEKEIKEIHSYDLPAVIALEIEEVSPAYREWIARYTRGK